MDAETLHPGLTDAQREAIEHTDGPLLIVAGPGDGLGGVGAPVRPSCEEVAGHGWGARSPLSPPSGAGLGSEPRLLKDINPGKDGSDPSRVTAAGGWLFFSAYDPEHGRELWGVPPDSEEPRADFLMDPESCQLGRRVLLEGPQVEFEYPQGISGLEEICLTVTNDKGLSDTACRRFCIGVEFRRGDANADGRVNLADAADADDSGGLGIVDALAARAGLPEKNPATAGAAAGQRRRPMLGASVYRLRSKGGGAQRRSHGSHRSTRRCSRGRRERHTQSPERS